MRTNERRFPRVPLRVRVTYRVRDQERSQQYEVESVDVGEGGIFLKTDTPLGIGTVVELEFRLPGGAEPLRFCGTVAWSSQGAVRGKGIAFTEAEGSSRERLVAYLHKVLS